MQGKKGKLKQVTPAGFLGCTGGVEAGTREWGTTDFSSGEQLKKGKLGHSAAVTPAGSTLGRASP